MLDHLCIILIDSLMETQLFENKNASTEIIYPIVTQEYLKSSATLAPNTP